MMILFDSHVHIYDCFDLDIFFARAFANFKKTAAGIEKTDKTLNCFLLFAESNGYDYFANLRTIANRDQARANNSSWKVSQTGEDHSLLVINDSHPDMSLFVVAGRQLVTAERLELLALFTTAEFEHGMQLDRAISEVREQGGFPVCPWGAGKWLGERGKRLVERLEQVDGESLFVGDSGGRAQFIPTPAPLKVAKKINRHIVSGTDPLPLAGEEWRVGSFGCYLVQDYDFDRQRPASSLKEYLLQPETEILPYGRLHNPVMFIKNQINIRLVAKK